MIPKLTPLTKHDFDNLDVASAAEVERRFARWISLLHEFLNALPKLGDVQRIRGIRPNAKSFDGNMKYGPRHWYTYHRGGRSEAQFNVGMFPSHLRIGIGFEPTGAGYGDPDAIRAAQVRFARALEQLPGGAQEFCRRHDLEVEINDGARGVKHVGIDYFLAEVAKPHPEERWIFIGRILRADQDRAVLGDASALSSEIQRVSGVLFDIWQTSR